MKKSVLTIACVAVAAGLAGCATDQPYHSQSTQQYPSSQQYPSGGYQSQSAYTGTVDRIEVISRKDPNNIAGTVIGGIIGGLIGHQIGGGTGNTVATIAGAAGGAYAGNQVQSRKRADHETFRVTVRMDNGNMQTVTQENLMDLRTGDRVRVDGNNISRY